MAMHVIERRSSPRIHVDGEISYRTDDSSEFRPGEIENLSIGGALIWVEQQLPADSRLQIRTVPDHEDETVFQFSAIVLCRLREQKGPLWGYSCRFELD
ncbi:MAG TPA: PilZ domain-containing protein [Gammaproteobacteria bacterium]